MMDIDAVLAEVAAFDAHWVTVTGGEPLAQRACLDLLRALCDAGRSVSLETSGAIDISAVDPRVSTILDIKTPGSGEAARNLWQNLDRLDRQDEVKFVLCSEADYEWARDMLETHAIAARCPVLFSPSFHQLPATRLAEWILRDRLPVRMQVQLHKQLWGEAQGR
jgi:7-carboxy-7-deazaguanine synthase